MMAMTGEMPIPENFFDTLRRKKLQAGTCEGKELRCIACMKDGGE
jgi:hypothetical protein